MRRKKDFKGKKSGERHDFVGLENDNSKRCYINSFIQTLFITLPFRQFICSIESTNNKTVLSKLKDLFINLQLAHTKPISTRALTESCGWLSEEQEDVQEFYLFFFSKIQDCCKTLQLPDIIKCLYEGNLVSCIKCLSCNRNSFTKNNFLDIQLPIENNSNKICIQNVEQAIAFFCKPEVMPDLYDCSTCGKLTHAVKQFKFEKLPNMLVLQLDRFHFDLSAESSRKITKKIDFTEHLDMREFLLASNDERIETKCQYKLFAVITHTGTLSSGHYYAYIKNFENEKWMIFNDEIISRTTWEEIQSKCGKTVHPETDITNAYILIYKQENIELRSPWKNNKVDPSNEVHESGKSTDENWDQCLVKNFVAPKEDQFLNIVNDSCTEEKLNKRDVRSLFKAYSEFLIIKNKNTQEWINSIVNQSPFTSDSFDISDYPNLAHLNEDFKKKYEININLLSQLSMQSTIDVSESLLVNEKKESFKQKRLQQQMQTHDQNTIFKEPTNPKKQNFSQTSNAQSNTINEQDAEEFLHDIKMPLFDDRDDMSVESISSMSSSINSSLNCPSMVLSQSSYTSSCSKNSKKLSKYVKGLLAVCPHCSLTTADFNFCLRCKKPLPESVQTQPTLTTWIGNIPLQNKEEHMNGSQKMVLFNHENYEKDIELIEEIIYTYDENDIILIYPTPPRNGGVTIRVSDLEILEGEDYLNDAIINLYIQYIKNEIIDKKDLDNSLFFDSLFFSKVLNLFRMSNTKDFTYENRFTRKLNIFQKDFLIIPVNQCQHWFLIVVCFANEVDKYNDDYLTSKRQKIHNANVYQSTKIPSILVFNSLGSCGMRNVKNGILFLLNKEYHRFNSVCNKFTPENIQIINVRTPEQENLFDCGLHLLKYITSFFTNPVKDFQETSIMDHWLTDTELPTRKALKSFILNMAADFLQIETV